MQELGSRIVTVVARRLRSRAAVELENLALRHQLHVLRRRRPGRLRLFTIDRLLWVWLYRRPTANDRSRSATSRLSSLRYAVVYTSIFGGRAPPSFAPGNRTGEVQKP